MTSPYFLFLRAPGLPLAPGAAVLAWRFPGLPERLALPAEAPLPPALPFPAAAPFPAATPLRAWALPTAGLPPALLPAAALPPSLLPAAGLPPAPWREPPRGFAAALPGPVRPPWRRALRRPTPPASAAEPPVMARRLDTSAGVRSRQSRSVSPLRVTFMIRSRSSLTTS